MNQTYEEKGRVIGSLEKDPINQPDHYTAGGIETIDYINAKLTPDQFEGYMIGNVLKYCSRYQNKNGIEDLKKAEWYLRRLIEEYDRKSKLVDLLREVEA